MHFAAKSALNSRRDCRHGAMTLVLRERRRFVREMTDIRIATLDDADEISSLVSALSRDQVGPSLGEGGLDKLLRSMNASSTRQRINDGWPTFCAWQRGRLVGVVVVSPPSHLFHLFVRSDFQRCGIGRALLGVADQKALELAGSRLATVNSSLNAISVYQRWGFVPEGPIKDLDGVRFQPMVRTKTA